MAVDQEVFEAISSITQACKGQSNICFFADLSALAAVFRMMKKMGDFKQL
jgi:hypothetical protein